MAGNLGELTVRLGIDSSGLTGGLRTAASALSGFAGSAPGLLGGVGLALAGTVAVALGVGVASVKMAADWQQSMTLLVNSAGESQQNIKMVSDGLLQMAVDTGTSTDQLAKGMFNVESAGYHGSQALQIEAAAARGAKVENSDLAATTDVLTTAMHNYHMPASRAVDVINSFRMAASLGKMHMDDLSQAMKNVLPIASQAGVGVADLEGALSTMSNSGDRGAAAGTHLTQMLTYLLSPSKKATSALKEVGLTTQKISDEMKVSLPGTVEMITKAVGEKFPAGSAKYLSTISAIVGGNKSMKAMLELSGQSLQEFTKDAGLLAPTMKANSTAVDGFAAVQGNFNFKMDQGKAVIETLGIKLGTLLLPVLGKMLDNVTPLIAKFGEWLTSSNGLTGVFNTLGKAWQGVMTYLNGDAFQGTIADFQSLGYQIGTIVGPAFSALAANAPTLGQALQGVGTAIAWIIDKVDLVVFGISRMVFFFQQNQVAALALLIPLGMLGAYLATTAFLAIAFASVAIPGMIAGFIGWAISAGAAALATLAVVWPILLIGAIIGVVVAIIILAVTHWGQITHWLSGVWGAFSSWFMALMGSIGAWFTGVWHGIGAFFVSLWTGTIANVTGAWNGLKNGAITIFTAIGQGIQNVVHTVVTWLGDTWHNAVATVVGWFSWLYNHNYYFHYLVDGIRFIIGAVVTWLENAWKTNVETVVFLWNWLSTTAQSVWHAITSFIMGIVTPVVAWLKMAWTTSVNWIVARWQFLSDLATFVWGAIVSTISAKMTQAWNFLVGIWNSITGTTNTASRAIWMKIADMWTTISGVFSSAWSRYISGPLGSLWNSISGWVSDTASKLYQSGVNFITMLANGIKSGAGAVWDAVKGIAGQIWKGLGFFSPTKDGPASTSDKWMPNLIKMMVSGLNAGVPQMQQAVYKVAQPIQQLQYPIKPSAFAVASASNTATPSQASNTQGQTLIFMVDSVELARITNTTTDRLVRLKLGNRSIRAA